jgi:hypothetical protein
METAEEDRLARRRIYSKTQRDKHGGAWAKNKVYNAVNREKYLAHKAVYKAIKKGTLVKQPCEICGTAEKVQAHHDDYSKRLDVRWLCPKHHKEHHAQMREQLREAA